jgi:hypothetical protein
VNTTRLRAVVTITGLFSTDLSILNTSPNATAPLMSPAYEIKTKSLSLMPEAYPKHSKVLISPMVAVNLPIIMIINSDMNNYIDHSYSINEKNVNPMYPNTNASIPYPIT